VVATGGLVAHGLRAGQVALVTVSLCCLAGVALSPVIGCLFISPILPSFQDGCKGTAGENSLAQRPQLQNEDWDACLLPCFQLT
jgi:hypothetical protein